ncbi:MAG: hypothetical protein O3C51_14780 [Planctomycetota bacterium]|nr:hypothetical protein [Planctomycetota bacterium]
MRITTTLLGLQLTISALCAQGGAATQTDFAAFAADGTNTAFDSQAAGTAIGRGLSVQAEIQTNPRTPPQAWATTFVTPLTLRAGSVGLQLREIGGARGDGTRAQITAGTSADAPGTTRPTQGAHAVSFVVPAAAGSTGTVQINWGGQASAGAALAASVDADGDGRPDWRGVAGTPDSQQIAVTAGPRGVRVVLATNGSATASGTNRAVYQGGLSVVFTPDGTGGGLSCTWTSTSRPCGASLAGSDNATGRLLALTLDVTGASPQGLGLLVVGAPAARPTPLPGSTCSLVLDLAAAQGLFPFITDAQGDASLTFRVPPRPLTTDFQAVVLGLGRGATLSATNGLNLVCQ